MYKVNLALLVAVLMFSGCKSHEPEIKTYTIEAQVKNGEQYNGIIKEIRAVSTTDKIIATAPYKNGGFTIELPVNFDNSTLLPIGLYLPTNFIISNKDAKIVSIYEFIIVSDEIEGSIDYEWEDEYMQSENYYSTNFMYADNDVTIEGTYIDEYDVNIFDLDLKKGWNIVYAQYSFDNNDVIFSTIKPDVNLYWRVIKIPLNH
jgi:hypothetical protein